ncbi:hypothetical protein [Chlamydia gallinacea]|uniref:Uncharacterized protein n=1 Tax=Chlamydia gallinacea TaxID=1457153 RepID=A0ABS7IT98_9CHLA|nr:hypothetical protein [Chlamydia gallinacea]MBX6679961.1 hypothetical protein [Chlamydia gallinacea]MBX6687194.1 hypothetical protein [Chlamydia gallinacea]
MSFSSLTDSPIVTDPIPESPSTPRTTPELSTQSPKVISGSLTIYPDTTDSTLHT